MKPQVAKEKAAKHTLGPWRSTGFIVVAENVSINDCMIADCVTEANRGLSIEEKQANAILIASAPDMLETLRMCEKAFFAQCLKNEIDGEPFTRALELMAIRQTIAKAEGRHE